MAVDLPFDPDWSEAVQQEKARASPRGDHTESLAPPAMGGPPAPGAEAPLESVLPPVPTFKYSDETFALESLKAAPFELREPVPRDKLKFLPWMAIWRLDVSYTNGKLASATGFLVDQGQVATAAHVLRHPDPSFGFASAIKVTPGHLQPDGQGPSQMARAPGFRWNSTWGTSPQSFVGAFDYGVIALPDPNLFARFGSFQWGLLEDLGQDRLYTVSGYPGEKTGQWRHVNHVVGQPGPLSVRHNVMTTPGQSGSPLFATIDGTPPRVAVIGVHSKESNDFPGENIARRVTREMIADYTRWKSELSSGAPIS